MTSRWIEIYATTPSGKTLFVCKICGRKSPTPDKKCLELPTVSQWKPQFSCQMLEEMESALIDIGEKEPPPHDAKLQLHLRGNEGVVYWITPEGAQRRLSFDVRKE